GSGGSAEIVALPGLAAEGPQDLSLVRRLHPLRGDGEPQGVAERDQRSQQRRLLPGGLRSGGRASGGLPAKRVDELFSELEHMNRERPKRGQVQVAGAEVVNRQSDAEVGQVPKPRTGLPVVTHHSTLG